MTAMMDKLVKIHYHPRPVMIGELVAYQKKHFGHIDMKDKKYKRLAYIESVDTRYSPKLTTYALSKGERLQCKVSKVTFCKQKIHDGDILVIKKCEQRNKQTKDENGKWVPLPNETEWWITEYAVVDNIERYLEK